MKMTPGSLFEWNPVAPSKTPLLRIFVAGADPHSSSLQPHQQAFAGIPQKTSARLQHRGRKWAPFSAIRTYGPGLSPLLTKADLTPVRWWAVALTARVLIFALAHNPTDSSNGPPMYFQPPPSGLLLSAAVLRETPSTASNGPHR